VLPTVPLNFLVQGTACWVKTKAMTRCHEQIQEWRRTEKFQSRIVLECHDELDIEMPAWGWRNKEKVKEIKRIMESCGEDVGIPLKVSMSYHPKNWAEEVKISLE
jgi:DNA polymerase I-like protein with 3'-5' exonuclease and polymerase domains